MPEVLILVFGYNHTLPNWEACMWGEPEKGVLGRASKALRISEKYSNPTLFLGGGGVLDTKGISVAQATCKLILQKVSDLYGCSFSADTCPRNMLDERLHLDTTACNTVQEVKEAFAFCEEYSISKMILVSSPTHIERCLQLALVYKEANDGCVIDIQAHPSDVNYPGTSAEDVVIVEPPHLPDSKGVQWNELVKRMIPMVKGNEDSEAFAEEFEALLSRYEGMEKK